MNTYSLKVTANQADLIKKDLEEEGASFDIVQYSIWRAKTSSFQAILYTSGKLLIQGKNIDGIVAVINNLVSQPTADSPSPSGCSNKISGNNENKHTLIDNDTQNHIGTDESGKGDFFGPLVIAGVLADKQNSEKFITLGVKDSKKLDDKKILTLAAQIKANSVHSVIVINPAKYNELYSKFKNLNKLLAWGHARAIENILDKTPCGYALADKFGDESLIKNALMTKGRNITLKQMVRAEEDIAVAAAPVLARAEFVKRIQEMENKYELTFSKGASSKVIEQAREYVNKYSFERLNEVAKMHFKTAKEL